MIVGADRVARGNGEGELVVIYDCVRIITHRGIVLVISGRSKPGNIHPYSPFTVTHTAYGEIFVEQQRTKMNTIGKDRFRPEVEGYRIGCIVVHFTQIPEESAGIDLNRRPPGGQGNLQGDPCQANQISVVSPRSETVGLPAQSGSVVGGGGYPIAVVVIDSAECHLPELSSLPVHRYQIHIIVAGGERIGVTNQ